MWGRFSVFALGAGPSVAISAALSYALLWFIHVVIVWIQARGRSWPPKTPILELTLGTMWVELTNPFTGLFAILGPAQHKKRWGASLSIGARAQCVIHFVWAVAFWIAAATLTLPLLAR